MAAVFSLEISHLNPLISTFQPPDALEKRAERADRKREVAAQKREANRLAREAADPLDPSSDDLNTVMSQGLDDSLDSSLADSRSTECPSGSLGTGAAFSEVEQLDLALGDSDDEEEASRSTGKGQSKRECKDKKGKGKKTPAKTLKTTPPGKKTSAKTHDTTPPVAPIRTKGYTPLTGPSRSAKGTKTPTRKVTGATPPQCDAKRKQREEEENEWEEVEGDGSPSSSDEESE